MSAGASGGSGAPFAPQFAGAAVVVSGNFGNRYNGLKPSVLVLHYTGMETGAAAQAWLCDPKSQVSSHYIVHEDGAIVQMVREEHRAWHAGKSSWGGQTDVNSFSVGIEIANPGHYLGYPDFPDAQIAAVIGLGKDVCRRHGIAARHVLAHSDVAPGRKIDPGEKFPWARLATAGLGHFITPVPIKEGPALRRGDTGDGVSQLQERLARYGYGVAVNGTFDRPTEIIVQEFQRHFRPSLVDGVADPSTQETLAQLLQSLGTS